MLKIQLKLDSREKKLAAKLRNMAKMAQLLTIKILRPYDAKRGHSRTGDNGGRNQQRFCRCN